MVSIRLVERTQPEIARRRTDSGPYPALTPEGRGTVDPATIVWLGETVVDALISVVHVGELVLSYIPIP